MLAQHFDKTTLGPLEVCAERDGRIKRGCQDLVRKPFIPESEGVFNIFDPNPMDGHTPRVRLVLCVGQRRLLMVCLICHVLVVFPLATMDAFVYRQGKMTRTAMNCNDPLGNLPPPSW